MNRLRRCHSPSFNRIRHSTAQTTLTEYAQFLKNAYRQLSRAPCPVDWPVLHQRGAPDNVDDAHEHLLTVDVGQAQLLAQEKMNGQLPAWFMAMLEAYR